jgi:uncharacterized repeat protein (TIGR01451 family)
MLLEYNRMQFETINWSIVKKIALGALFLTLNVLALSAQAALSCGALYGIRSGDLHSLSSPYTVATEGASVNTPSLSGVNSVGINPLDLNKIYFFDAPPIGTTPATNKLYYFDVSGSLPVPVSAAVDTGFTVPSGAGELLAFSADGYAYTYDYTTGRIYSQKPGTYSLPIITLSGTGMPSTTLSNYKVNDIVVDAAGKLFMVGLHPVGAPTSAHLLKIDPVSGVATYVKALTLAPSSPFPTLSSGLAFAPTSTDAAPKLVWTASGTGTYDIDVNAGTAIRGSSNSQADLASCPLSNIKTTANLTLQKAWVSAKPNDKITATTTGGSNNATIVSTANAAGSNTDVGTAVIVNVGDTLTLPIETWNTGLQANYDTIVTCTGNKNTLTSSARGVSFKVDVTDSNIVCTYINSRKSATLTLKKTWVGGKTGDQISVTTTGAATNATLSSTSSGSNTTTGTAVAIFAGEVITIPTETWITGAASDYSTSALSCVNHTASSLVGNVLTVAEADAGKAIECGYTNTGKDDGNLEIKKSTITKEASTGDVVEYAVTVTNTSSVAVVSAKVTDTPPVGFAYVAGSAKIGDTSVGSTSTGSSLVFDLGTIAAKSSIVLTYKMRLGDAVEAGEASNCVSASGVSAFGTDKESSKSCATVIIKTGLFLDKRANVTKVELGDSVEYSLRIKSVGGTTKNVTISDKLPLGFKLIEGTVKVIRGGVFSIMANPAGSPGPALTFNVGTVANNEVVEIRYRLRLGIGADFGDGINKAQAKAPYATPSLSATAKVLVTRGVFTREACIVGKVFVDCNQNKVQDKCVAGSKDACEPGIPGVRLYMEDATNITTDENGLYSICGIRAISHVMAVDMTTMPIGSRMGLTSNENLGSGKSLLLNIKAGELHRADFIESSCFPKILDQIKQRQANSAGIVNAPLTQTGQDKPGIVFDSKEQELLVPALRGVQ